MKRPSGKHVLALAVAVLVIGAATWALWPQTGPRYAGQPLRHWLVALAGEDHEARLRAEAALQNIGPEALPALTRALHLRDSPLTQRMRRLRARFFPRSARPVPADHIAGQSARLLGRLGPVAAPAVPDLLSLLTDPTSKDTQRGYAARVALGKIGEPALPALLASLDHHEIQRREAVLALLAEEPAGRFGPGVTNAVPALLRLLHDPAPSVPPLAITALKAVAPADPRTVPALSALLRAPDPAPRVLAAIALGEIGRPAGVAAKELARLTRSKDAEERLAAATALWRVSGATEVPVAVLSELLESGDDPWKAALVLGEIGPPAAPAIPRLLRMLETDTTHRASRTPNFAAVALGRLGPAAVPGLKRLLSHTDSDVRVNAAAALQGQGTAAVPAVPGLIQMLRAEDLEEQMAAANALGAIGPGALPAAAELSRLARLETTQEVIVGHVRSAARGALARVLAPSPAAALTTASP